MAFLGSVIIVSAQLIYRTERSTLTRFYLLVYSARNFVFAAFVSSPAMLINNVFADLEVTLIVVLSSPSGYFIDSSPGMVTVITIFKAKWVHESGKRVLEC